MEDIILLAYTLGVALIILYKVLACWRDVKH